MLAQSANFDVKCMMCSAEVGQILNGKFLKHACGQEMPRKAGMLRCCHCSGSLYLDPIDVYPAMMDRSAAQQVFAPEAA